MTMDEESQMEATLAAANALKNPLEGLERLLDVKVKNDDSTQLSIRYQQSPLSDTSLQQCLALFEHNMGDMYRQSDWGLDMKEKQEEFQHENAKFLLLSDDCDVDKLLAFCHFRFDWNDDEEPTEAVLYVYEIQVNCSMRHAGLGRRLMTVLELVARQAGMRKTMLTVFKKNTAAWNFYTKKLKYSVDESSPSLYEKDVDYEILCKRVR